MFHFYMYTFFYSFLRIYHIEYIMYMDLPKQNV